MAEEQDKRETGEEPADLSSRQTVPEGEQDTTEQNNMTFLGFVGSFSHSIDAKGRLIIPASFREPLGNRFAVCPTPDFKAVAIYPLSGWVERRDELMTLVKSNARAQRLLDQFSKYSYVDCEADAQGRLLLPQKIRSWRLGDARDVDVNGAADHVRVMPSAESRAQDENFDAEFEDPLDFIARMQRGE